jgi:hypothetical protein
MSDLELPDLGGGHDLIGIDLEKGIYLVTKFYSLLLFFMEWERWLSSYWGSNPVLF